MIESYEFGKIVIAGKTYHTDVIVYPDRVDAKWWRKQGHSLDVEDIQEVFDANPDTIIVGTGQPGMMQVPRNTLEETKTRKITMKIMPTEQACKEYNRIASEQRVIACLHLTC